MPCRTKAKDAFLSYATNVSVKGGVVRVIDSATGDIARTTSGWIEDEKYGWYMNRGNAALSSEFDSGVTRTGKFTVKLSATDISGVGYIDTVTDRSSTFVGQKRNLITLKPSTAYILKCFVKTNNVVKLGKKNYLLHKRMFEVYQIATWWNSEEIIRVMINKSTGFERLKK